MKEHPLHPWRLALVAVLVGLAWYGLVPLLARDPAGMLEQVRADGPLLPISFALGAFVPTRLCRRFIASMPLSATFPASLLWLALGALCFAAAEFASIHVTGCSVEEVQEETTLLGKLLMSGICVLFLALDAIAAVAQTALVSLPLCWLSILSLRSASGGLARDERTAPSAA